DLLPPRAAAGAAGHGHGRRLHDDPDLERPVVPADPGAERGDQDGDAGLADLHRPVRHQLERGACGAVAGDLPRPRPLPRLLAAADPRHHLGSCKVSSAMTPIRVRSAGLGNMGRSHALAYHENPGFEIVGLVNRSKVAVPQGLEGYEILPSFPEALKELKPELCSVNTYSDS